MEIETSNECLKKYNDIRHFYHPRYKPGIQYDLYLYILQLLEKKYPNIYENYTRLRLIKKILY